MLKEDIKLKLEQLFPNAGCELDYRNIYELSVAVILSAQTTDKSVNIVTPNLFSKYPTVDDLASAKEEDVQKIIRSIGLFVRKSQLIINFAKCVANNYNGIVPDEIDELIKIPGIGRKTANVIVSEGYKKPGLAVDVHVIRVSKRLGLVPETYDAVQIEYALKELFDREDWHQIHHLLIFMGRYMCKSQKPLCEECPFITECKFNKR